MMSRLLLCSSLLMAGVAGHGLVKFPKSRNQFCGQEIKPDQAKSGACKEAFADDFNGGYQFMAVLTHNLGRAKVKNTNHVCGFDSETWKGGATPWDKPLDWPTNKMSSGRNKIVWNIQTGPHFDDTDDFKYWITKPNFVYRVGVPLSWDDFEEAPFCNLRYNDKTPNANPNVVPDKAAATFTNYCNVPKRSGRHVIYGEWGRRESTYERFHTCIDGMFDGSNSGGGSMPDTTPMPTAEPVAEPTPMPTDYPTGPCQGSLIDKYDGCTERPSCCAPGLKCHQTNAHYSQCVPENDGPAPTNPPTNNGGGHGGDSGSTCAMPAGMSSNPSPVDNRNFVACHGKLTLGGKNNLQLVDSKGEAVQLTGMSSHGLHWFPSCYNRDSIEFLAKNWGINVFRAAMYVGEGGYATDPSVKSKVHQVVKWCKEIGIYVIIDWHMLNPGNPNDNTYSGAVDFFKEMAMEYKYEEHVLFETANEPNNVQWGPVKAYHNKVIKAIRAIDKETIIIAGTPTWSQDIHLAAADPVAQPYNVMYTFHFYAGTHMGLLSRVEEYASQIPIFITEWGTSLASGDGGPYLPQAKQFLDLFKSAGKYNIKLSWAQWSYADKSEISAALQPGACSAGEWDKTSCSGTFLKNYIKANAETCSGGSTPSITPRPPMYTQRPPMYTPRPPVYTPRPPVYTPRPPMYTPRPPSNGQCSRMIKKWGGCAKKPGCCEAGLTCVRKSRWYSQCRPGGGAEPTPSPPVYTPKPPMGGGSGCAVVLSKWDNCHHGKHSCCGAGLKCKQLNPWYSQCL